MRTVAFLLGVLLTISAFAQVPFYNNTLYDPQIEVVESGSLLDVRAIVSADKKYVTITARPQITSLVELKRFEFVKPIRIEGILARPGMTKLD